MNSIDIASSPGTRGLFATSLVARLPIAMLGIALLVDAHKLTGSFGAAGIVTAVYALSIGLGGPLLGQLVDRRGQTLVLLLSGGVAGALLVAFALLPGGTPLLVMVALAGGIGLAEPPIGACLRTMIPELLSDQEAVRGVYALEASAAELTYIAGPPLALCIGALWSAGTALAVCGIVLLVAVAAFALQPDSRNWKPAAAARGAGLGSVRTPAMVTLILVLVAVGMLLGADEVAVIAAARTLHAPTAAAPLFAVWGTGSLFGGLLITRLGGGARTATGLGLLLLALTVGHLALIPAHGSVLALAAVLLVAGAAVAPTEATLYAMVDNAAPAGSITEAFAWLATAMAVGSAVGAAAAGQVAQHAGPTATFGLAGACGMLAILTTLMRSRTLAPAARPTPVAVG
jgi:predicted MFS family arabinose efflux permease